MAPRWRPGHTRRRSSPGWGSPSRRAGPGTTTRVDWLEIRLGRSDAVGALDFFQIQNVLDPETQQAIPLPQDLVGWFTSHPALDVLSPPRATTIGGVQATQLDVAISRLELWSSRMRRLRAAASRRAGFRLVLQCCSASSEQADRAPRARFRGDRDIHLRPKSVRRRRASG